MKCQRDKFQLQRKHAYLNCAYMSPLMKKVEHAGIQGIKRKRKPFHIDAEDFFDDTNTARKLFSKLIDSNEPERVVVIPSVSYGMSNVVSNLPCKSGEILIAGDQFPSNVYPWREMENSGFTIKQIAAPNSTTKGEDWNFEILKHISNNTQVVAISHVHWSDGTIFQLKEIRKKLDEVGGLLIIDGTQSIGAFPFSIDEIKPDAVICAAYKWLMGPYSIGLAYYGPVFDGGIPIEKNWQNKIQSDDFSRLIDYQDQYRSKALRYEVGEHSNFILIPMLIQALKQVLKWQPQQVQDYCERLTQPFLPELNELGYSIDYKEARAAHLFGIKMPKEIEIERLKKSLAKHRVSVSVRGDFLRVSPHVYNDEMDMRKLLKAMKEPILAQKN